MARASRKDYQRLIRWYQDETGVMEFKMADVAKWAEAKGNIPMPVPPTPAELLAKKLAKAASADRRDHAAIPVSYRGTLCYGHAANGQVEYYWFDADGPAASRGNVLGSDRLRREGLLNIGVQIAATDRHWSITHPDEAPIQTDLNLMDEVTWRLNAPALDSDEDRKAG